MKRKIGKPGRCIAPLDIPKTNDFAELPGNQGNHNHSIAPETEDAWTIAVRALCGMPFPGSPNPGCGGGSGHSIPAESVPQHENRREPLLLSFEDTEQVKD